MAGTFAYTPAFGAVLKVGQAQTLSVAFTPTDTTDYTDVSATATINVGKAIPTVTWSSPAAVTYGTPLSATQLDATATVPGTFTYVPALGTVLGANTGQTLSVSFTPADAVDYTSASALATIVVDKAVPILSVSAPGGIYDGNPFPASCTIRGINNSLATSLEGVTPTLAYFVGSNASGVDLGSTPPAEAGTYSVVASFAGSADYAPTQSTATTFVIQRGSAAIALAPLGGPAVFGQSLTFVATVQTGVAPGGTVTFMDGTSPLATVAVDGTGRATLTTASLAIGSQPITAIYSGSTNFIGARSTATLETVIQDATKIVMVTHPVYKKKVLQAVNLTAEIEPVAPGGGVPTGTVLFEYAVKRRKKVTMRKLASADSGRRRSHIEIQASVALEQDAHDRL